MTRAGRVVTVLVLFAAAIAACDRVVDLSPPPSDGQLRDAGFDGDARDGGPGSGNDGGGVPDAFVPLD